MGYLNNTGLTYLWGKLKSKFIDKSSFPLEAGTDNGVQMKGKTQWSANVASEENAFAVGEANTASGVASFAEGAGSTASGMLSHAEGGYAVAAGSMAHAEGYMTIANGIAQHVSGLLNIAQPAQVNNLDALPSATDLIEIVGNGTVEMDMHTMDRTITRSNARTLDYSGNEKLAGSLTLGMGTASETTISATQLASILSGGMDGDDGITPDVTISSITGGHTISFFYGSGDSRNVSVNVMDGATGQTGQTGATGADGADGDDGITPEVTITTITGGHTVSFIYGSGDSRNQTFDIMDGAAGTNGTTPVKGTDYWTSTDKQEIIDDVLLAALPVAEGVSF